MDPYSYSKFHCSWQRICCLMWTHRYPVLASSGHDDPAHLQYPVRALRIYLHWSHPLRKGQSQFFLPLHSDHSRISAQTLSSLIKAVIKETYEQLSPSAPCGFKVWAHEIWAVAASLAFQWNVALTDIMADFCMVAIRLHLWGVISP